MIKKRIYLVVLLVLIISILSIGISIIFIEKNTKEQISQKSITELTGQITWKSVTGEGISGETITGESVTGELVTGELVTGEAATQGFNISLSLRPIPVITIIEPANQSYSFNLGDTYVFYLNVSGSSEIDTWWFTLVNLKNSVIVNESAYFLPNETFNAVAFSNELRIYANDSSNFIYNNNVTFYVSIPVTPPYFEALDTEIFGCEGSSLNYRVNVTDIGGDNLIPYVIPSYSLFYPNPLSFTGGTNVSFYIISGELSKTSAGGANAGSKSYETNISITDDTSIDSQDINITIIEINNPPYLTPVENQSVQTGTNTTFSYQIQVEDQEEGEEDSGNLNFNVSIIDSEGASSEFFNINSTGDVSFEVNSSIAGVYNLTFCVEDNGLASPHPNISSECNTGGSSLFSCSEATLTITEEEVTITPTPSPRGGGGWPAPKKCTPKWVCEPWYNCENLEKALDIELITFPDYSQILAKCSINNWNQIFCGVQTRECTDLRYCNTTDSKPTTLQECYYTREPSCKDEIKNCHDGSCELLVDCGGPCPACPTCSDGIQNQGEKGVDCGGPCIQCKLEKPQIRKSCLLYLLLIIIIILLLAIIENTKKIMHLRKKIRTIKLYQVIIVLILLFGILFYVYPKYQKGDFIFDEGKNMIGEIKDESLTEYVIRWQDGTFSKESRFRVESIRYLDEEGIMDILKENNEDGLSFYSWNEEGEILTQESAPKEEFPGIFSLSADELENFTIKLGEKKCGPKLICGAWNECDIEYTLNNAKDVSSIQTLQTRYCRDSRSCVADFIQTRKCEKVEPIRVERRTENNIVYIDLYNSDNRLAFQLREEEYEQIKKLYIELFIA